MTATDDLTILGAVVRHSITAAELETFPAPDGCTEVELVTEEFTSLCPLTAQPDHATVSIRYAPSDRCLESKSLKLYLWDYREKGVFVEGIAAQIAADIHAATKALWTRVVVEQRVRGGIVTTATSVLQ